MNRSLAVVCLFALLGVLTACASPAINSELLRRGARNVSLRALAADPGLYRGRLFILGGKIISTRVTDEGSVIEALNIPVNSDGVPETVMAAGGRYLAVRSRANGILDPAVYKKGAYITVAGYFTGTRIAKLDSGHYTFTVFNIARIRLWKKPMLNTTPPPPYYPYYGPFYHNPYGPNPYGPYYGPRY
ncbi:MAG: Slp family lipoprotein [Nitrospiraceae bacterium]|nr:Slp family lipoprotein [Nitrospiraceae bacterium]